MLKIALCDDDTIQIELLQELLAEYNTVSPHKVEVASFFAGSDLLRSIRQNGRFDIYILDVMMPDMDGLALARRLRENDDSGKIVFLSSATSFVFKAFAVSASGYLIKPINPNELYEMINTLREKIEKETPSFVQIIAETGLRRIEVKDILYVDTIERAPVYHLKDGSEIIGKPKRCKFQELVADLINGYPFVLASVGVAVNLENVDTVNKYNNEIMMKNGQALLCSRTMKDNFVKRLEEYWNS